MRHRVLVVDDYPDAVQAICALLDVFGHECRGVTRGREAIEVAREFEPDIALVDISLPDISGYDVARRLRELAGTRPLFLTALTGWGLPQDRNRAIEAGFDHHVLKPFDVGIATRILQLAELSRAS